MLFFRNNTTISFFLSLVRTAHHYSDLVIANAVAFVSTVIDLLPDCANMVCFCYKFILND